MTHVTRAASRGRAFGLPGLALAGVLLMAAQPSSAAVISTLPQGVAQAFPTGNIYANSPRTFGDGVTYNVKTLAGGQASSHFGATGTYTFNGSGSWSGVPYAAFGLQSAVMSFSFADPVSAALAEFNWSRNATGTTPITFRAYNSAGKLLESLSFASNDPARTTGFYGFQRAGNDISRFEVDGYWVGARNLSTFTEIGSAVPEPATWAMMIIGFGGAGAVIRRRRYAFAAMA